MNKSKERLYRIVLSVLSVLFILTALAFFIQFSNISAYNRKVYSTMGYDEVPDAYVSKSIFHRNAISTVPGAEP